MKKKQKVKAKKRFNRTYTKKRKLAKQDNWVARAFRQSKKMERQKDIERFLTLFRELNDILGKYRVY